MIKFKKTPNSAEEIKNILHPVVNKWFFTRFKEFSLPQLYGVLDIHSRKNILISAPTGATKTLTGFLSILNELIDSSEKKILDDKIYCVYISPLKALNEDIKINLIEPLKEMEKIAGKDFNIRVSVRTGDTTQKERSQMLKKPPHILITTPESLAILLTSPKFVEHLKDVQWCIIDEIHSLAENKRGVHLSLSLERLHDYSKAMTRVGLSATISPIEEIAKFLVGFEDPKKKIERPCSIVDVQYIKELDIKVLSPVDNLITTPHEVLHQKMYELIDKLIQEHRTTLIFTNTRAATERVVNHLKDKFPKNYTETAEDEESKGIGAHHGSLSPDHRHNLEKRLREGKLRCVVSSTSLELGIDIGYIDLVILLGSPKSVARALQRIGRSGHRLHEKAKGRIIVLDRDDLVECSVLLKSAIEKKIDRIHIPKNCLDVLAQQIFGIAIADNIHIEDLYNMVRRSYCYSNLDRKDFRDILDYLSGKFADLEDRHIYSKIWHNEENGMIGRKGRMSRVIYMTNIGTIPDESFVTVKVGNQIIGKLDEGFLEKLKRGNVFVLGGEKYEFLYSKGMVAYVNASVFRPPTIPSWVSESLPLSFDLAMDIGKFRRLMSDKFCTKKSKDEIIDFILEYLYVDKNAANSLYQYFKEQFNYIGIPDDKRLIIESYDDEKFKYIIFHALYGRRVNDCLSRAIAFAISRSQHKDVELGISDNGFYLRTEKRVNVMRAIKLIKPKEFHKILNNAIENTEVLKRRFRHCAARSLMILRNYMGRTKRVGRQQVSSMILINSVKRIDPDFSILKEARREVLEDLMDIDNAQLIIDSIEDKKIKLKELNVTIPSPFAFNLVAMGYTDMMKIDDKMEFLKRMHELVQKKIILNKGKKGEKLDEDEEFDYNKFYEELEQRRQDQKDEVKEHLKFLTWNLKKVPVYAKEEIVDLIEGKDEPSQRFVTEFNKYKDEIKKDWPKELVEFVAKKIK
ncbi:MAG: ATP-dependent helicase [Candidatus Woesearchaeota archaeon]